MKLRALVLLVVAAAVLAACGGDDDDPTVAGGDDTATTTGDGGTSSGAPIPGGGLTVEEALASDLDGPLLVAGYLIVEGDTAQLCDGILESYPPQCGDPSLVVEGLDLEGVDGLQREGDRAWTDEPVSLLGDVTAGTLTVSETAT